MTHEQILALSKSLCPTARIADPSLIETHISWVILTDQYAYKLKKPLKLAFLDFSTLALREACCKNELALNRRLAPKMYLQVVPIFQNGEHIGLESHHESVLIDYALQMQRMANALEMDQMLLRSEVVPAHMEQLAQVLAPFHLEHRLPPDSAYQPEETLDDFLQLFTYQEALQKYLDVSEKIIVQWKNGITTFFKEHKHRLLERHRTGMHVDGHGDLHARNIFLTKPPTIFDCIEFNDHFRKIDILNDLAFLCMDLEHFGMPILAEHFIDTYTKLWNCLPEPEDRSLFTFYKAYRANVRLKVTLIEMENRGLALLRPTALAYWNLMQEYGRTLGIVS
jgi:aminoglycoside phosphotransferase family enzyme